MSELLPCPFCGGEASVERIGGNGYYFVACSGLNCCDSALADTEAEAIAAWNTRAERTCEMEYSGGVPDFVSLDTWWCTECGSPIYNDCEPSYCEYCGAKVVGE